MLTHLLDKTMDILYITSNEGKFLEAKRFIPIFKRKPLDLEELQSLDPLEIINHKAEQASFKVKNKAFVVDDVSLFLEALDYKLPGPLIKWFLKSIGSRGIYEISKKFNQSGAIAICTLGYVSKDGRKKIFQGKVNGNIIMEKLNSNKSWDSIFMPAGSRKTFGEMSLDEKNEISHRGMALKQLKEYLGL